MSTLLRPRDLAEQIDVDPSTVRRWLADGRLPAVRTPGGRYRIDPQVAINLLVPARKTREAAAEGA
jgi:excisionase family DNA binding protein